MATPDSAYLWHDGARDEQAPCSAANVRATHVNEGLAAAVGLFKDARDERADHRASLGGSFGQVHERASASERERTRVARLERHGLDSGRILYLRANDVTDSQRCLESFQYDPGQPGYQSRTFPNFPPFPPPPLCMLTIDSLSTALKTI